MLVDFPDYSLANQWQIKTIEKSAPIKVHRTNELQLVKCYALHISWEDYLLKNCGTAGDAITIISKFENYLKKQSNISKIIWTVHNLRSHNEINREAEKRLREIIMEHASTINLMSLKHRFIIPEKHKNKINIVPHYIDRNPLSNLDKRNDATYFRFGADRGRKDDDLYINILNDSRVKKFVSDKRLNIEVDDVDTVITKRRFTINEAEIYAQLSNFSTFYQKSNFNSGVLNFMIGKKLAVFHDKSTVKYMDLPLTFKKFCVNYETICKYELAYLFEKISIDHDELDEFIEIRNPEYVSKLFWDGVYA